MSLKEATGGCFGYLSPTWPRYILDDDKDYENKLWSFTNAIRGACGWSYGIGDFLDVQRLNELIFWAFTQHDDLVMKSKGRLYLKVIITRALFPDGKVDPDVLRKFMVSEITNPSGHDGKESIYFGYIFSDLIKESQTVLGSNGHTQPTNGEKL